MRRLVIAGLSAAAVMAFGPATANAGSHGNPLGYNPGVGNAVKQCAFNTLGLGLGNYGQVVRAQGHTPGGPKVWLAQNCP